MEHDSRLIELYKQHHYDSVRAIIRKGLLVASVVSCGIGIAVTAATGQQLPMFLYIAALVSMALVLPLKHAGMVSDDMACSIPTIFFCFVYTPVNWFSFNGLLGSTPYLSVVFIMVILLLHFKKRRDVLLGIYITGLVGLTIYDLYRSAGSNNIILIINAAAGYIVTLALVTFFLSLLIRRYERMANEVLGSAVTDELTGMLCRRVVNQVTAISEETYKKDKYDYMVLMLDVDKLKKLNAEYGRAFGDGVLQDIAECIRKNIRSTDYAIRSGDDEFLIILTDAAPSSADSIIERLDKAVKETLAGTRATVSHSSVRRSECREMAEIIELADRRLAQQKHEKKARTKAG
jgi:diguanylate cyclase (GGDEF)-like protein